YVIHLQTQFTMLTKHEVRWCLATLWIASVVGVLPLEVDRKNGKIHESKSRLKKCGFKMQLGFGILHILYLAGTWLRMLIAPDGYKLIDMAIQPVVLLGALISLYNAVALLIYYPQGTVLVFNELYSGTDAPVKFRWLEYSIQEFFTILSFLSVYLAWSMLFPLIVLDPTSPFFVGSICNLESAWHAVFFGALEILLIYFIGGPLTLSIFIQLSMFVQTSSVIRNQVSKLRDLENLTQDRLWSALQSCRRVNLNIVLYNQSFAYTHYLFKISSITASVVCIFCGLEWLQSAPVHAFPIMVIGVEVMIVFVIMYDNAFGIPEAMESLKERILMVSVLYEDSRKHGYTKRTVKAVSNSGVKVGSFSTFESTSTPVFVDFVMKNVVNLLLAF
ncbi:unnamed protein product, partial [Allacma fusca]